MPPQAKKGKFEREHLKRIFEHIPIRKAETVTNCQMEIQVRLRHNQRERNGGTIRVKRCVSA